MLLLSYGPDSCLGNTTGFLWYHSLDSWSTQCSAMLPQRTALPWHGSRPCSAHFGSLSLPYTIKLPFGCFGWLHQEWITFHMMAPAFKGDLLMAEISLPSTELQGSFPLRTPGAVEGAASHAPTSTASSVVPDRGTPADGLDGCPGPGIFSEVWGASGRMWHILCTRMAVCHNINLLQLIVSPGLPLLTEKTDFSLEP